jgi:N-acetyltransferase
MTFEKVPLVGEHVSLEPLSMAHQAGLVAAVADGELWRLMVTVVPQPQQVADYIKNAELAYQAGDGLAFAIIVKNTGQVVGSTRFLSSSLADKRTEIGYTFLAKSYQRSAVNTETKFLLLRHAFEQLAMNRVELLTDYLNARSRAAISRLGAKEEGVIRSHLIMPDGRVRDSVLFSIIKHEWHGVKQNLLFKLGRA